MTEPSADFDHDAANLPHHDNAPTIASDGKAEADGAQSMNREVAVSHTAAREDAQSASSRHTSSNIMILWPERDRFSDHADTAGAASEPQPARSAARRRRRMVLAGVAAIAALSGAAGGSIATLALGGLSKPQVAAAPAAVDVDASARLRDAVAHVTADLGALRTDFDRASHARTTQVTKLGDRLDKIEKAQDEANARLTKFSETQEKLQEKTQDRMRQASATPAAADVTGSIAPAAAKGDLKLDPKKQIVEGWTLAQVTNGGAIVNGPDGAYEAFPGDPLPGIGRVEAVRYVDGRWAVITAKGLIVRR